MEKKIMLTGVKPTGMPHIGNYVGAIRPAIALTKSDDYEGYCFIADYHTLTILHDAKEFKNNVYEVAATWLALGLDAEKITIYRQSDIPEILELNWILSCFTSKGLMNRAHAYKAIVADNESAGRDADQGINIGIYTYPVLMSADILFLNSNVVPVGEDQLQHIEIARDIANCFNSTYGETFTLPEAIARKDGLLAGLDGRKMSKSYNNHIPLFVPEKKLKKLINKLKTDSSEPHEPKETEGSLVFDFYKQFATDKEIQALADRYQSGIGWGEAKAELFNVINREIAPAREEYNRLLEDKTKIDEILAAGAKKVRPLAIKNLEKVKRAIGVS